MKCGFDKEYSKLYSILPSNDEESFCFDNRTFQLSNTTLETEMWERCKTGGME